MHLDRRTFTLAAAAGLAASAARAQPRPAAMAPIPMIETTPHIWNPHRPLGTVFRPDSDGTTAAQVKAASGPDVVGTIVLESSPWIEDNMWLLDAVADDPFFVGVVGNLRPDRDDFAEYVERYNKHPMYLGIRHGNIWQGYDLPEQMKNPRFIEGLKLLAQADLVLDLANPRLNLLEAAVRINDAVPNLRVIVDHLPAFRPTAEEMPAVERVLREFSRRPNIYLKLTSIRPDKPEDSPATVIAAQRQRLDHYWDTFGEDRVIGGNFGKGSVAIYTEYMKTKSRAAQEKYFWKNSARIYKWVPRTPQQPRLA